MTINVPYKTTGRMEHNSGRGGGAALEGFKSGEVEVGAKKLHEEVEP